MANNDYTTVHPSLRIHRGDVLDGIDALLLFDSTVTLVVFDWINTLMSFDVSGAMMPCCEIVRTSSSFLAWTCFVVWCDRRPDTVV